MKEIKKLLEDIQREFWDIEGLDCPEYVEINGDIKRRLEKALEDLE